MKKRWLLPIVGGLLGVAGGAIFLVITKSQTPVVTPTDTNLKTTLPSPKYLSWNDPAGFIFEYPEGLVVNKHDEDQENYAHVELTHPDHPGRVIVWSKDLPRGVTDSGSWVKQEKRFVAATLFDTTLGGLPAKKVLLASSNPEVFIGTVEEEVLFYIEAQLDNDNFWNTIVDSVTGSFAFKTSSTVSSAEVGVGEEEAVDEEIVVE